MYSFKDDNLYFKPLYNLRILIQFMFDDDTYLDSLC